MTKIQLSIGIPKMHPVSPAIAEILAIGTIAFPHPFPIPIRLITAFPHLHEIVLIDVSLVEIRTDAGTSRNGTVYQYGTYRYPCLTCKEMISHLAFLIAKESFATIIQADTAFLSRLADELHDLTELGIGQLQFLVVRCTSHRDNGEHSPTLHT